MRNEHENRVTYRDPAAVATALLGIAFLLLFLWGAAFWGGQDEAIAILPILLVLLFFPLWFFATLWPRVVLTDSSVTISRFPTGSQTVAFIDIRSVDLDGDGDWFGPEVVLHLSNRLRVSAHPYWGFGSYWFGSRQKELQQELTERVRRVHSERP